MPPTEIAALAADQAEAGAFAPYAMIGDRHLKGGIHRFRAGIGEEHMIHALRRNINQPVGQFEHDRMTHLKGRRVVQFRGLGLDRFHDLGSAMAGIDAPQPRSAVQNLASVTGGVVHVLRPDQHAGRLLELPVCREGHPECA
jgi:hypothetical protein